MQVTHNPHFDKISRNKVKCLSCNEVIESKYTHDFQTCSCGSCSVDGGLSYVRVLAQDFSMVEYQTEYRQPTYQEINEQIEEFKKFTDEWKDSAYWTNILKSAIDYKHHIFGNDSKAL